MVKRIVSGIFILTALGVLGVILAGAMTSGEQLIVRFLTAVTVAALALYVISDLRLQSEQEEQRTDSNRQQADRSAEQATAAPSSHRRERFVRRGREASPQGVPNFEAIEPVTARSRPVAPADPTEAVTGSRLVPPAVEQAVRTVPPHPMSGHTTEERAHRPTPGVDEHARMVDGNRIDAKPEFVTPPDERRPNSASGSAIATTAFTYSGRLDATGVEWPAKPPGVDGSGESVEHDGLATTVGAIDAPTAELPALTGLSAFGTDEDPPPAVPSAEIDDAVHCERSDPDAGDSTAHLFAIDTAEHLVTEPSGSEDFDPFESADMADRTPSELDSTAATPLVRRIDAAQYAAPPRTDHLDLRDPDDVATIGDLVPPGDQERPVPAVLPAGSASSDKLTAAIRSGESQVINSLISQGMLSTSGPITDRDVRTMVYVAFTSNELRKLILAGGTPDGIRAGDLDLGEVELFDESRFAPPPKLLYSGPLDRPDTILDLVALEKESASTGASDSSPEREHDDLDADLVPTLPTPRHVYRRIDADRIDR